MDAYPFGMRRFLPAALCLLSATVGLDAASYHYLRTLPLGGEGGWDYISVDPATHRLFVSHATKVVIVDTRTDQVTGEIADTPGIHGVAVDPRSGHLFTSNGREDRVGIVDGTTLQTLGKVATGPNPDTVLFEPKRGEIYAFNGRGASVTVIDAATGAVTATLPLGGKPEFAVADPAAGRVYVNLEDKNEIIALDAARHEVVARWPIGPGESATGLAFDDVHHRLFAGCDNHRLIVLDSTDGHLVADVPAGAGIDGVAFDPGTALIITANGQDGTATVVHEDTPDKFSVVQTLVTEPYARTIAVDSVSHKLYLPTAKVEMKDDGGKTRRQVASGSFKVLVYELVP
jgi:YVTN family beta-propeller protein